MRSMSACALFRLDRLVWSLQNMNRMTERKRSTINTSYDEAVYANCCKVQRRESFARDQTS